MIQQGMQDNSSPKQHNMKIRDQISKAKWALGLNTPTGVIFGSFIEQNIPYNVYNISYFPETRNFFYNIPKFRKLVPYLHRKLGYI